MLYFLIAGTVQGFIKLYSQLFNSQIQLPKYICQKVHILLLSDLWITRTTVAHAGVIGSTPERMRGGGFIIMEGTRVENGKRDIKNYTINALIRFFEGSFRFDAWPLSRQVNIMSHVHKNLVIMKFTRSLQRCRCHRGLRRIQTRGSA